MMKHKHKPKSSPPSRHTRPQLRDDARIKNMLAHLGNEFQDITFTRLKKAAGLQGAASRQLISRAIDRGFLKREDGRFTVTHAGLRLLTGGADDKKRLSYKKSAALVEAKILRLKATFAFARPTADGDTQDVFIPGSKLSGALPGDIVLLKIRNSSGGDLKEGEVVEIVKEAPALFAGTVTRTGKRPEADLPGLGIQPVRLINGAVGIEIGERVVVRVNRDNRGAWMTGDVVERFGTGDLAENCAASLLAAEGILPVFPEQVDREALWQAEHVPVQMGEGRVDLRDMPLFTIDGASAKDLDDAVSISFDGTCYHLGVHIADVSAYVTPGSALDREAFRRGTSIYYANRVIPMLPKALSNGACSLNPDVDRLAFSCRMVLDAAGKLIDYRFDRTIIRSRVRGVYSEVNALLDGSADETVQQKYAAVYEQLVLMEKLAGLRANIRAGRGVPEIETGEIELIIGEDGKCCGVKRRERGKSEGMIEEFMLLAGESAARLGKMLGIPFVYRIHQKPDAKKIETLKSVMLAAGLDPAMLKGEVPAATLRAVLQQAKGSKVETLMNRQVLRTMMKAAYDDRPIGHYGLVLEDYAHFTSPIRRYPDLAIHRIIGMALELSGGWPCKLDAEKHALLEKRWHKFASQAAAHSSEAELRAMELERQCEDCYRAEYMHGRIGDVFDGIITGVTAYGLYVETDEGVEGLVQIESLPVGDYLYDGMVELKEQLSGTKYRVGDKIRVRCTRADVSAGTIDFCAETAQKVKSSADAER